VETPREGPQVQFDAERRAAWLLAYERTGEKKAACGAVGIGRQTLYDHLRRDPEFRAQAEAARDRLLETLMGRLKHVAVDGVEKTTYDKDGNVLSVTRTYDVRALLAWIKRLERDKWGDHVQVDKTVKGSVDHVHRVKPAELPKVARDRMRDLLDALPADDEPSRN
jgi:hypothetical protein